jgi:hypothetical protein
VRNGYAAPGVVALRSPASVGGVPGPSPCSSEPGGRVRPVIGCLYEDRVECLTGLKLAILSLSRHCPQLPLIVTCPGATESFRRWLGRFSQVEIREEPSLDAQGWDLKPALLARRLAEGHSDVVWIDADLLVTAPLPPVLEQAGPATCVVAEEPYRPGREAIDRARLWGFPRGRTLNSCIVRVTPHHVALLEAW